MEPKLYGLTYCALYELVSNTKLQLNHSQLHVWTSMSLHMLFPTLNVSVTVFYLYFSHCHTLSFKTQPLDHWLAFLLPLCHSVPRVDFSPSASYTVFQLWVILYSPPYSQGKTLVLVHLSVQYQRWYLMNVYWMIEWMGVIMEYNVLCLLNS